ncbi:PREDICTED: leucine-rich repeat-containing protein 74B-like [Papilio polytes]|uniref:leucine-rich repeat-containing protein 74B-like n=1 Tax=Papilio polytes TaxID=76194 RepID=UPI00067608DC|nr:PREDICTED: leucine-rich repeat-containing protein 74B-like [Papilio polytes]
MSSDTNVEVVFEKDKQEETEVEEISVSSEEPPMEEWSSLIIEQPEENIKRINYTKGLYDPGSGEICTNYITMSSSSVLRHPYYNYPAILDLGVKEALLNPEPLIIYPEDGQDLYLSLCKESGLTPISSFHRQLLENEINLRYYGIQQKAFRAIALSLNSNMFVNILDLTDNWIDKDGCFHLGEMLAENGTLTVLNLCGCRIGPEGAKRLFINLPKNKTLQELILSRNQLYDEGVEHLALAIKRGTAVCKINLSYNSLSDQAVLHIGGALEVNNKLTHLNLSWNMLKSPNAIFDLCCKLEGNENFLDLDLSWNTYAGQKVGISLGILLNNPNFLYLNLSNNKLNTQVVNILVKTLREKSRLLSLDMSCNPLTSTDAYHLLSTMLKSKVKLQKLKLDNILVTTQFLTLRDRVLKLKFRKDAEITYGDVYTKPVHKNIDLRDLVLNRIDYLCRTKFKKHHVDIALIVMELYKLDKEPMPTKPFLKELKDRGLPLEEDLANQFTSLFAGPFRNKSTTVNMAAMIDFFKRKWPDRKLPPTPPPSPPPEPPPPPPPPKKGGKKPPKKQK